MPSYKPKYETHNRKRFTGEEGKLFVELFADKNLRKLAQLHYVEGYPLDECAEKMDYSNRHIERMNARLKDKAIDELMSLVSSGTSSAMMILKIKNIVCQGV